MPGTRPRVTARVDRPQVAVEKLIPLIATLPVRGGWPRGEFLAYPQPQGPQRWCQKQHGTLHPQAGRVRQQMNSDSELETHPANWAGGIEAGAQNFSSAGVTSAPAESNSCTAMRRQS